MNKDFLQRLTEIVETNLNNETFGPKDLAREMGVSHSKLYRKLKSISNQNISQFIRELRLMKAKELLLNEDLTASEVSYRVGFGSPTYFNKCFHEYFGYSPGEINKQGLNKIEGGSDSILPDRNSEKRNPGTSKSNRPVKQIILLSTLILISLVILSSFMFEFLFNRSLQKSDANLKNKEKSIVVLPFKNLNEIAANQYFAEGITENILNHLCRIKNIRVVSRITAEHFQKKSLTAPEIAKALKVNYVLDGRVSKFGNRVEIFVQLIDARHDRYLLSEKFESEMSDVLSLQSDISKKVAIELEMRLSPNETKIIENIPTTNTEAYDLYLMGRFFLKKRTKEDLKKSIEYFEKSVSEDADFALAYSGLAEAYWLRSWWGWGVGTSRDDYLLAKELAMKALQLNENLCETHAILGNLLGWGEWKWEEARKELALAIELNPNFAEAHYSYSRLLDVIGENSKARIEINKALELDPYYALYNGMSGVYYYKNCDNIAAIKEFNRSYELEPYPSYIHNVLFKIYFKEGDGENAIMALRTFLQVDERTRKNADLVQEVYIKSGLFGLLDFAIKSELAKSPTNDMYYLATLYSLSGRKSEALDCLEKIMRERTLGNTGLIHYSTNQIPVIANDADFNCIKKDSRYLHLIKKMDLYNYFFAKK